MSLHELVLWLVTQPAPVGLVLGAAGLVFLLGGYSIHKALLGVSFAAIGLIAGLALFPSTELVLLFAAGAAGVATFVGLLLPRIAMSALAGACGGLTVWYAFGNSFGYGPVPAIVAGVVVGGLALAWMSMMYMDVVATIMSFEGTLLALAGFTILMEEVTGVVSFSFRALLRDYPMFGYFVVTVITLAGALYQSAMLRQVNMASELATRRNRGRSASPPADASSAGATPTRLPAKLRPKTTVNIQGVFDFFESGDLYIREDDGDGGVAIDYSQTFEAGDWRRAQEAILADICQLAAGYWPLPQTREHWKITVHWPDGSMTRLEKDWCGEWCGQPAQPSEETPPGEPVEAAPETPAEAEPEVAVPCGATSTPDTRTNVRRVRG